MASKEAEAYAKEKCLMIQKRRDMDLLPYPIRPEIEKDFDAGGDARQATILARLQAHSGKMMYENLKAIIEHGSGVPATTDLISQAALVEAMIKELSSGNWADANQNGAQAMINLVRKYGKEK